MAPARGLNTSNFYTTRRDTTPHGAIAGYLADFIALLESWRQPIALNSCKRFGGTRKLLRFDGDGISITCDLPRCRVSLNLLDKMDRLIIAYGAHTNLIKDCRVSAETVRAQYPEFEAFRAALHAFDPKRLFVSELSERLGL